MARPLGGWELGARLLLADGFCLGNGGPGIHLLNHAVAGVGHHPGWGCLPRLGEIGIRRLVGVVIDEVIFHVLGPGPLGCSQALFLSGLTRLKGWLA